jgi:outer membrane protein OmpA-like peptidoglycan-associated protein
MKKLIYLIVLIFVFQYISNAVDYKLNPRYGVYGHYQINMHSPEFSNLPNIPNCCPLFEVGSGSGFAFGLLYETPITNNILLGLRAGYSSLNGELSKTEETMMFAYGERQEGEFEHTIDATINNIGLEGYLSYGITEQFYVSAGLRSGFKMTFEADQAETISEPSDGATFMDENGNDTFSRVRNQWSGEVDNSSSFHLFAFAGLNYELPLNKKKSFLIVPELRYYYGLNDIVDDINWCVNTLNIGLALKYSPSTIESKPGKSFLSADVNTFGIDKNGQENPVAKIVIEEFSYIQLHPLLTYVFFDKNSSEIPKRYNHLDNKGTKSFSEKNLYGKETLEIYYNMLNIIGRRMLENPKEEITLTGCNDNTGSEKSNKELSQRRAETIKDYFVSIWKIEPTRIIVKSRNLPATPSNINENDGMTENRRVEISSDSWEIIKPVMAFDTLREVNPEKLRFYPNIQNDEDIRAWNIAILQNSKNLKNISGNNYPDEYYDWNLLDYTPTESNKLNYLITAKDEINTEAKSKEKSIPIEVITVQKKRSENIKDKETQRYSLILFEFNSANLGKYNERIIDIIKDRIAPNSQITITGHTDRIGSEESNKSLSEKRANSVRSALSLRNVSSLGMGEKNLLFNNDLPEGRFYCRTVNVLVETIYE